jgi:hypothetical protein
MPTETLIPSHVQQIECDEIAPDDACGAERIAAFVVEELVPLLPNDIAIATVDGFNGAGKTAVARHLSNAFEMPLLSLDDFLIKGPDSYADSFNFDILARKVEEVLLSNKAIVIEGCFLEAALERIGRISNFRIYVMRTTRMRSGGSGESIIELYGFRIIHSAGHNNFLLI